MPPALAQGPHRVEEDEEEACHEPIACQERQRMKQMGWCRGLTGGVDELGDVGEPVIVEVVGRAIAQELACHKQRNLRVRRPVAGMRRQRRDCSG